MAVSSPQSPHLPPRKNVPASLPLQKGRCSHTGQNHFETLIRILVPSSGEELTPRHRGLGRACFAGRSTGREVAGLVPVVLTGWTGRGAFAGNISQYSPSTCPGGPSKLCPWRGTTRASTPLAVWPWAGHLCPRPPPLILLPRGIVRVEWGAQKHALCRNGGCHRSQMQWGCHRSQMQWGCHRSPCLRLAFP